METQHEELKREIAKEAKETWFKENKEQLQEDFCSDREDEFKEHCNNTYQIIENIKKKRVKLLKI